MTETTIDDLSDDLRHLVTAAKEATSLSYSPYSHLQVGAALLCRDGTVVTGTNMENASYSLAICAERVALASANSQGLRDFLAIAVTAHGPSLAEDDLLSPCGACRQTLLEFAQLAGQDIQVVLASPKGKRVLLTTVQKLLPLSMGRNHVKPDHG
jgi:cytidine deaminase